MNVKQHIRMTASEIAMGRYMRAPDHPTADDEFSKAFDAEALKDAAEGGGDAGAGGAGGGDGVGGGAAPAAGAEAGAAEPAGAGGDGTSADGGAGAPAAPADGGAAVAAEPGKDGQGGAGAPAGEGGAGSDGAGGDAGAAAPAADGGGAGKDGASAAAVPPPADADAILDRLAGAIADRAKPADAKQPAGDGAGAEPPPLFSAEETAALDTFKQDWPKEYEAINLMQRELGVSMIRHVFNEVGPVLKEVRDTVLALATRVSIGDVADALGGEYPSDEEIDKVKDWVKTQPTYLQAGMNGVIEGGTPDEIVDLVGRYREATGAKPAASAAPAAETPAPKPAGGGELSDAAKQAAAGLAPVDSKRSAVQPPDDTSDFDGAFEKYAALEI